MIKKCLAGVRSCSHHVHYGQTVLFHSVFLWRKTYSSQRRRYTIGTILRRFLYAFQFILRKKNQFPAMVLCLVPYYLKGETR